MDKEYIKRISREILESEDLSTIPVIHPIRCNLNEEAEKFLETIKCVVSPKVLLNSESMEDSLSKSMDLLRDLCLKVLHKENDEKKADEICNKFINKIPEISKCLILDLKAAYDGDPAAKSIREIVLAYPGYKAIMVYRIAHELYILEMPLLPRVLTEIGHKLTRVDIHPGAKIGDSFFIDHGTGVVIGETCTIGKNVKIYQGVTLGARSFKTDSNGNPVKGIKRHPDIGDNVVIYSGATILGGDTVIGENSVIGGSVWLTYSVPPNTKIFR